MAVGGQIMRATARAGTKSMPTTEAARAEEVCTRPTWAFCRRPAGRRPLMREVIAPFGNEDDRRPCTASERWPTSTMLKATLLCRAAPCQPKLG
jgi:hypothetical protein